VPASIAQVVVSSFSDGILYSHSFRATGAGLQPLLGEIWDLDGSISTVSQYSADLRHGQSVPVVQYDQNAALGTTSYHVPWPRWADYYDTSAIPKSVLAVHPLIRDFMYLHAGTVSTVGLTIQPGAPQAPTPQTPAPQSPVPQSPVPASPSPAVLPSPSPPALPPAPPPTPPIPASPVPPSPPAPIPPPPSPPTPAAPQPAPPPPVPPGTPPAGVVPQPPAPTPVIPPTITPAAPNVVQTQMADACCCEATAITAICGATAAEAITAITAIVSLVK
jgi:hypothetical protein